MFMYVSRLCFLLGVLRSLLFILLPTLFITSLSYTFCHIQSWAHFYGCNNRQGHLGCLHFEICELFMKIKSYHTSLEEHSFSISPTFTRHTKLSFIFWFPANVTRIETRIKITNVITRKMLELFSLIHFLFGRGGRINCILFCKR
jgi:hypothetical protein